MNVAADAPKPGSTGESTETDPSLSKDNAKNKEFVPPTDGSWVPRERLNSMSDENRSLRAQLEDQVKKQNARKPVPRDELLAKVEAGDMSQAEADNIWQGQIESSVADQVEIVVKDTAAATKMQTELDQYEKTVPELSDESSELYAKVAKEYRYLTQTLGMPDVTSTTLAAVRSVVGPADSLKKVTIKKNAGDGHFETGGGNDGKKPGGADKIVLTDRQKDHYRKCIDNGLYPNWDAVYKELEEYNS